MKCGNCKGDHEKVSEVKDCYALTQYQEEEAKAEADMEARAERFWEEGTEAQHAQYQGELEMEARALDYDPMAVIDQRDEETAAAAKLDAMTGTVGNPDPPSDKQVRYALDLLDAREWPDKLSEEDLRGMRRRQVSTLIGNLKESPLKPQVAPVPNDLTAGMYKLEDGTIVRVYLGQRSGNLLAKKLTFIRTEQSSPEDIEKGLPETWERWEYQYMGRADRHVKGSYRQLSIEEAKQWGKTSSTCCRCARRLDVPESVDAGIGPVCATKDEW